jgi:hypothetical protein
VFPTVNADQVDQWVFNRFGGPVGARTKLDSLLALRIDEVDRLCGLTDVQKQKLHLAGRGDVKRFFDRVEESKRKFASGQAGLNPNVWQELQPLQGELNAGLFGEESLYAKMVKRILTAEQSARYDGLLRERRLARYRATIERFVAQVDKALGLTESQRRRYVEVLLSDTPPPRTFGLGDYWYLMLQSAALPEGKLKPIFDVPQWRLLSRQLQQARGMEPWLRQNNVLPDNGTKRTGGAVAAQPAAVLLPFLGGAVAKKALVRGLPAAKTKD